jgi:hypothetical protein
MQWKCGEELLLNEQGEPFATENETERTSVYALYSPRLFRGRHLTTTLIFVSPIVVEADLLVVYALLW